MLSEEEINILIELLKKVGKDVTVTDEYIAVGDYKDMGQYLEISKVEEVI